MFRLFSLLEKSIREGEEESARNFLTDIIKENHYCVISYSESKTDPITIFVTIFYDDKDPFKVKLNVSWDETFLEIKRKICGEFPSFSPYCQKLFILKGTNKNINYEFPKNSDILRKHFPRKDDFDLHPISVYVTKNDIQPEFEDNDEENKQISKWACKFCTYENNDNNVNCEACQMIR